MPKTKTPLSNKYNGYGNPEEKVLSKGQAPLFSDDEGYLYRKAVSTMKGLQGIVKEIVNTWKGSTKTEKIGRDLHKYSARAYEAEQEVERLKRNR